MTVSSIVLFLIGITIIVAIHELGHMLLAKMFKMRVEIYSIGFHPAIWRKKIGETEYTIGAIPCGGFVKISGMINESLDNGCLDDEAQPWEFRAKPAWQRLIVILGGVMANVLLGILIFSTLTWLTKDTFLSKSDFYTHGIYANEYGANLGFKTGDKVLKINSNDSWMVEDIFNPKTYINLKNQRITVEREGKEIDIQLPEDFIKSMFRKSNNSVAIRNFISPRMPFKVAKENKLLAELQIDDEIIRIGDSEIKYYDEFKSTMMDNVGNEVTLTVRRGCTIVQFKYFVDARLFDKHDDGFLEVKSTLSLENLRHGFFESIFIGVCKATGVIRSSLLGLRLMFDGSISAKDNLSGPIGIMKMFKDGMCVGEFFTIIAILSISLALMNIFPLPALDGGHALLIVLEMILRKRTNTKVLVYMQYVGMALLLTLLLFTTVNDLKRAF